MRSTLLLVAMLLSVPAAAAEGPDGAYVWIVESACTQGGEHRFEETEDENGRIEGSVHRTWSSSCDEGGLSAGAHASDADADVSAQSGGTSSADEEFTNAWTGQRSGSDVDYEYELASDEASSSSSGTVVTAEAAGAAAGASDTCEGSTEAHYTETGAGTDTYDGSSWTYDVAGQGTWAWSASDECATRVGTGDASAGTQRRCESASEGTYEFEAYYAGSDDDTWSDSYREASRGTETSSCRTERGTDGAHTLETSSCSRQSEGELTYASASNGTWSSTSSGRTTQDCESFDGVVVGDVTAGRARTTHREDECIEGSPCQTTSTQENRLVVESDATGRIEQPLA